jgi:hypothetical protein
MCTASRLRDGRPHVSLRDLLERVDLEQLLGDHPLELAVLALELLEPLRIVGSEPAVLSAPALQCLLGDLELLAGGRHILALAEQAIGLAQLPDDLLRRVPAWSVSHRFDCPPCPCWAVRLS